MTEIRIPTYKLSEELLNSISHGIGAIFGIAALVTTTVISAIHHNSIGVVSSVIYGISMIFMFSMSCIYHSLSPKLTAKKVFRVIDHCDIYIYIAGCYTPFCLSLMGGFNGWLTFAIVWICAIIGVLLNAIDLEKYEKISLVLYLVMGWMIVFSIKTLIQKLNPVGFYLLLAGGIAYTIGAILYGIGAKKPYFHSIFHFFVLLASILQFCAVLYAI